jgi:8-oxo-dGTP diphosphatase
MSGKRVYTYENPRPAVTVDIVVTDSNTISKYPNVLLIQRSDKSTAFPDAWALPGGFVNPDETCEQAAVRELEEETGIKITQNWEDNRFEQVMVQSAPNRDPRDRIISIVFMAEIDRDNPSNRVKAGDDAQATRWFPLDVARKMSLAFDHNNTLLEVFGDDAS